MYRSYGNFKAFLVEKGLRCPSLHYFRHERASELKPQTFQKLAGLLPLMKKSKFLSGFEPTPVMGK
jgi:hypothetical protein